MPVPVNGSILSCYLISGEYNGLGKDAGSLLKEKATLK